MSGVRAREPLLVTLFFFAWALVFSFPLLLHMAGSVALSRGGDVWLHLWDLWWVDKSLVDLHRNPYHTAYILYPSGLNLYYHSLDLLNSLVAIPLNRLFGLTFSFNLLVLLNLTLDGAAAYALCRERAGSWQAGIVGGMLFASAPLLGTSLNSGQLDEMTVWWVPLYMLALVRAVDTPAPLWNAGGGRRAVLAAGVCLIGSALATWYFTAGLVVFTVLFVPAYLASRKVPLGDWVRAAVKVAGVAAIFVLVLSPLLYAMVRERLSGATYMLPSAFTTLFNSADLVGLFLPARVDSPVNAHGSTVALGYVALLLAGAGLVLAGRKAWPAGLAFLVLVVMALGPELQVNGTQTGIPLPYAILNNVPFVGASRQPLRFLATAAACMSLLAAFGVEALLRNRRETVRTALTVVAGMLIMIELFSLPRVLTSTQVNPAYTFLRDNPASGAVLELPNDVWSAPSLWNQTVHNRPILGGYTSRHFPYPFVERAPGVAQLFTGDPEPLTESDILSPPVADTALLSMDYYNVRFVVVHKADMATSRYERLATVISRLFADKDKAFENSEVVVYATPKRSSGRLPLAGLGAGWHTLETNPTHRWTGANGTDGNATVWIGVPPGSEGNYSLALTAYSYASPRHLTVQIDGTPLTTVEVGTAFQNITVNMSHLRVGDHTLTLGVQEPPETPPGDTRKVALGVTKLVIERTGP